MAKSSRWVIDIRGKAHDLYLEELNQKVQDIQDNNNGAEISMDQEIDFPKAERVKSKDLNPKVIIFVDGGSVVGYKAVGMTVPRVDIVDFSVDTLPKNKVCNCQEGDGDPHRHKKDI